MKIESGKVYTFKLNSGEELIAKVVNLVDDNTIELEEPVSLSPGPKGMGLIPSIFTQDPKERVVLNTRCITMWSPTLDQYKDKYLEATTGIKVPEKKIITG